MDKFTEKSMLIDFYGKLLTEKQLEILDMYYNNDYSLAEIGEILGISRQGVHDSLKRSESILSNYEDKLNLVNKFLDQNEKIKAAISKLRIIENISQAQEIANDLEPLLYDEQ